MIKLNLGDLMNLDEFYEYVMDTSLTDYDGFGNFVKSRKEIHIKKKR